MKEDNNKKNIFNIIANKQRSFFDYLFLNEKIISKVISIFISVLSFIMFQQGDFAVLIYFILFYFVIFSLVFNMTYFPGDKFDSKDVIRINGYCQAILIMSVVILISMYLSINKFESIFSSYLYNISSVFIPIIMGSCIIFPLKNIKDKLNIYKFIEKCENYDGYKYIILIMASFFFCGFVVVIFTVIIPPSINNYILISIGGLFGSIISYFITNRINRISRIKNNDN